MLRYRVYRLMLLFLVTAFLISAAFVLNPPSQAWASTNSISFQNAEIEIQAPASNKMTFNGTVNIAGETSLEQVWVGIRGPQNEIVVNSLDVVNGRFNENIQLRFGWGEYTVWAGNNSSSFDGSIRFQITNELAKDTRYTTASEFVDSNHHDITYLANSLVHSEMNDMEKLSTLHVWVTNNIAYDFQAYLRQENILTSASQTLANGKGMCRDYSFLMAALARAAGLPARVVYGETRNTAGWDAQLHAWNEIMVDGNWVTVDATWNAGFIQNGAFVAAPSKKFFNPDVTLLASTHSRTNSTLH